MRSLQKILVDLERTARLRPLEREFPQKVEFLLFEGVHKYDLSYSESSLSIQYTLLALRAREVYWILDSEFTRGRTYRTPAEIWESSIEILDSKY